MPGYDMLENPELSVLIPVFNEEGNLKPLTEELLAALRSRMPFEIVFVDDCSSDNSMKVMRELQHGNPEIRLLRLAKRSGKSLALRLGAKACKAHWIITLDGDGQNDPADIRKFLKARDAASPDVKMFAGWRIDRQDTTSKRWASRLANRMRNAILHDATPDTGCGFKLFERDAFLEFPFFDNMHRYLPALMQRDGWRTQSVRVDDRPRLSGVSKYNNLQRALVGIRDLRGVAWLIARNRRSDVEELR